jgi:hypothetical protein
MSNVLRVESCASDGSDICVVIADISDIVVARAQTYRDPAEYGAALCRGTFYLQDDEVIPTDDDELCRFVEERVNYWEVLSADPDF